jgi:hypothetical protein
VYAHLFPLLECQFSLINENSFQNATKLLLKAMTRKIIFSHQNIEGTVSRGKHFLHTPTQVFQAVHAV